MSSEAAEVPQSTSGFQGDGRTSGLTSLRRSIATTVVANVIQLAATGLTGILITRSIGPSPRGEYAAIMVWFGVIRTVGELGLTTSTTFFVARNLANAREYIATSRRLLVLSGVLFGSVGMAITPALSSSNRAVTIGYLVMFGTVSVYLSGASFIFGLQGAATTSWNLVRVFQPVAFASVVWSFAATGKLTLTTCLNAVAATIIAQAFLAYLLCRRTGLSGGSARRPTATSMAKYGAYQFIGVIPAMLVTNLDQLALSLTVEPASLGHYAAAVSLTALALPAASALGSVVFPRIALQHQRDEADARRTQRQVIAVTIVLSLGTAAILMASARWAVPFVFGSAYREAVPLVWILAPGVSFLAASQICADILRGYGHPLVVARAQWLSAAGCVVSMTALLPIFGVQGAAVSTSFSSLLSFFGVAFGLRRHSAVQASEQMTNLRSE